ncbi:MAG: flagellar motor protein MotB [Pseudomonadota bacterium]
MSESSTTTDQANENKKHMTKPRRYKRRAGDNAQQASNIWLISFTDVMALMLTFFVMLFSMANPEQEKFEVLRQNISQTFTNSEGTRFERGQEDDINIAKIDFNKALDLRYLRALIDNLINNNVELQDIIILENANRLIISVPQEILFESGSATIKSEATRTLFALIQSLKQIKNSIEIIGHTDPVPVSSSDFASNWELSLTRAAGVAGILQNAGYRKPITIKGYASGRYDDLDEDFSVEERNALSRRVDIIIREDSGQRFRLFDVGVLK